MSVALDIGASHLDLGCLAELSRVGYSLYRHIQQSYTSRILAGQCWPLSYLSSLSLTKDDIEAIESVRFGVVSTQFQVCRAVPAVRYRPKHGCSPKLREQDL